MSQQWTTDARSRSSSPSMPSRAYLPRRSRVLLFCFNQSLVSGASFSCFVYIALLFVCVARWFLPRRSCVLDLPPQASRTSAPLCTVAYQISPSVKYNFIRIRLFHRSFVESTLSCFACLPSTTPTTSLSITTLAHHSLDDMAWWAGRWCALQLVSARYFLGTAQCSDVSHHQLFHRAELPTGRGVT